EDQSSVAIIKQAERLFLTCLNLLNDRMIGVGLFVTSRQRADGGAPGDEQADSDHAIIQQIQTGKKQALSLLYDRYARLILGVGLRILRDSSEAQELVQDVFLYVFQKSRDYDPSK